MVAVIMVLLVLSMLALQQPKLIFMLELLAVFLAAVNQLILVNLAMRHQVQLILIYQAVQLVMFMVDLILKEQSMVLSIWILLGEQLLVMSMVEAKVVKQLLEEMSM